MDGTAVPGLKQEKPRWLTGTAVDRYTPVYLALNTPTKERAAVSPGEADGMDLTVIAAMLGVGRDEWDDWAEEMRRGRMEAAARGERWEWPDE